jgi:hypothetical protein
LRISTHAIRGVILERSGSHLFANRAVEGPALTVVCSFAGQSAAKPRNRVFLAPDKPTCQHRPGIDERQADLSPKELAAWFTYGLPTTGSFWAPEADCGTLVGYRSDFYSRAVRKVQGAMAIEPSSPEMVEAFAAFGRDLLLVENGTLGAKEIPLATLLDKTKSWFGLQEPTLRKIICTQTRQVKPEITAATNLIGIVAAAIRAHYGDQFPYSTASAALVSYGLARFCMAQTQSETGSSVKTE